MDNATLHCACDRGVDVCTRRGSCVSFCDTKTAELAAANAAIAASKCTGPFDQSCGPGRQCVQSTQCRQLVCDADAGITTTPCYGFCMASERTVTSARISSSGSAIVAVLSTSAASASFACASLFDTTTSAVLGSGAWCAADGQTLMVRLGQGATLIPGVDSLTLSSGQSVLVDRFDTSARFLGTAVAVSMCDECAEPAVMLLGPKVLLNPRECSLNLHVQSLQGLP